MASTKELDSTKKKWFLLEERVPLKIMAALKGAAST